MNYPVFSFKFVYFLVVMFLRNIKWLFVLTFQGSERVWNVMDFKMFLTARKAGIDPMENSIHKQLILSGIREKKSTEIMQNFIKPDDVILELGANIGYYVLMEAKILSENGHIYAIEPAPANIDLLKKNTELNSIKNVDIYHMAISNKKGTANLYFGVACNLHSLIKDPAESKGDFVQVNTDTVDGFLSDKKPITFLRMDIEGYETEIFEGMKQTLGSSSLKKLFIEIHPHRVSKEKMRQLFVDLKEHGFETAYCVSHDKYQRDLLGQTKVEDISLDQLMRDKRVLEDKLGFELFLHKK